ADDCTHRLAVRYGRDDDVGTTELRELRAGILRPTVDVVRGAELPRECLLVRAARDRNGPESHLRRNLDAEMAEATDAEHRNRDADESVARFRIFALDELEAAIRLIDLHRAHRRTQWQ